MGAMPLSRGLVQRSAARSAGWGQPAGGSLIKAAQSCAQLCSSPRERSSCPSHFCGEIQKVNPRPLASEPTMMVWISVSTHTASSARRAPPLKVCSERFSSSRQLLLFQSSCHSFSEVSISSSSSPASSIKISTISGVIWQVAFRKPMSAPPTAKPAAASTPPPAQSQR